MVTYEVEAKWELDFNGYAELHDFFMKFDGAKRISSTDHFYKSVAIGDDVMRLRIRPEGAGFITVKKLVAKYVRRENEIKLSKDNEPEQIFEVLKDLNFKECLQIHKAGVNFSIKLGEEQIPHHVGLYMATANTSDKVKFFLELEVDKEYIYHNNVEKDVRDFEARIPYFLVDHVSSVIPLKECDKLLWQYFI
jgi:adenylate cyclase class IV